NTSTSSDITTGSNTYGTTEYSSSDGIKASTTGNVYGIYDLSGGAFEYVAGYIKDAPKVTTNGSSLQSATARYKDVYTDSSGQSDNYNSMSGKYGDAVYETSSNHSSNTGSWFNEYAHCPLSNNPFFLRGGHYNSLSAGLFGFNINYGGTISSNSFRPVLAAW
ncbi:MAG: hypothetical protein Q4G05_06665, partial [Clostridia bacterium]|nr:hypothetical protein [Clostridia bacterium]